MDEHEKIRKPGWGHPIMLLYWAILAAFLGFVLWLDVRLFIRLYW